MITTAVSSPRIAIAVWPDPEMALKAYSLRQRLAQNCSKYVNVALLTDLEESPFLFTRKQASKCTS